MAQSLDPAAAPGPAYPASSRIERLPIDLDSLVRRVDELERQLEQQDAEQSGATKSASAGSAECPLPQEEEELEVEIRWTSEVQSDFVTFSQSALNKATLGNIENGVDMRRARLGAVGTVYDTISYRIDMEFADSGRPSFLDAWVGAQGLPVGNLRIGHFTEPTGLERQTSNRFMTFMERSLVDQFSPVRNVGIMAWNHAHDQNLTWAYGFFRTGSDEFGDDTGDGSEWAGTARVTCSPWYEKVDDRQYVLHLGGSYSLRGPDEGVVEFDGRPEIQLRETGGGNVPVFVDTGEFSADHVQLLGAELALVLNSFSIQTEYASAAVARPENRTVTFDGAYAYVSYFLTGEHRPYFRTDSPFEKVNGTFDRVKPHTNVWKPPGQPGAPPGIGAWEIGARWSHLNLSSGDIQGGRLTDVTLGLNWYLNPYTKLQWNYIHTMLDDPSAGSSTADIFGMRAHFDF